MQHVLQPVFYYYYGAFLVPRQVVYQFNGRVAHLRVQRGQRFVKNKYVHVAAKHAGYGNLLLLPAGKIERHRAQKIAHTNGCRMLFNNRHHFAPRFSLVLHGEGNVLRNAQPNKLRVAVLQNRAHGLAQPVYAAFPRLLPHYGNAAGHGAVVGKWYKSVYAVGQRAFAAAGTAQNKHFFALINGQVYVVQRGLVLHLVLKRKILKNYGGFFHSRISPVIKYYFAVALCCIIMHYGFA